MSGSSLRLHRMFSKKTGRSFMVAFDRTLAGGPERWGEDSGATLERIAAAQPDAVLMSAGLLKAHGHLFAHRNAPAVVLRLDFPQFAAFRRGEGEYSQLVSTPEEAVRLGADAVVMFLCEGFKDGRVFAEQAAAVAEMARRAAAVGIPLIVEAVLWGEQSIENSKDVEALARVCRVAAELGADAVKTEYPGNAEGMRKIVDGCPVPVLVLGGSLIENPSDVREMVDSSLSSGASGVIFGRNVWQREDTVSMAATIREAVHGC